MVGYVYCLILLNDALYKDKKATLYAAAFTICFQKKQ
jgi:hypothetical protein